MSTKTISIIILALVGVFIGLVMLATGGSQYQKTDQSRPRVETQGTSIDVGEIKLSDVITRDFEFKNTGENPLKIENINSSCGCTVGQIIYKDFSSGEFGMHAQSGYVTEIAPGDSAVLRLIYRPATMPVYGLVQREVYLSTNSPDKPRLVFGIKAIVR
jgi:hypothetical protein